MKVVSGCPVLSLFAEMGMTPNVRVELTFYALKIYIDDALHLFIRRNELIGFQAWRDDKNSYKIEYLLRDGEFLTEYDSSEKFLMILKLLDEVLK